ncbi:hypothetical protein C8R46DRAFT_894603 [Mycena filopes]|nr:hypothetical protein C8R46DRAFT_894603 [Mycena filopes]
MHTQVGLTYLARSNLKSVLGRSVQVKPGRFSEAVREFEKILRTNAVRHTWVSTQRHEKKGPKRRRIRSEQWRKHFSHQVRKNVQLVHKIRRRGV